MKRIRITLIAAAFFTAASGAPSSNDQVIPLIEMRDVPLPDALRQMARQGRLNVILDPRLSQAPYSTMTISVRWENVTAREALNALLDNYGLALVESPRSRVK